MKQRMIFIRKGDIKMKGGAADKFAILNLNNVGCTAYIINTKRILADLIYGL